MQKFNKKILALTVFCVSINSATAAEETPQDKKGAVSQSVLELTDIKSQISYTKALTELEKARFQLGRAKSGIFDDAQSPQSQTTMPGMYNPLPNTMSKTQDTAATGAASTEIKTPRLAAVYGGAKLTALFKLSDGSSVEAKTGDTLPGGFMVKSVTVDRVQLVHEGKVINVGS